jgi:hypothetical protein
MPDPTSTTTTVGCPLDDCDWTITVRVSFTTGDLDPDGELAIREHFDTHPAGEWAHALAETRRDLDAATARTGLGQPQLGVLYCAGCIQEARKANAAGAEPQPVLPARTVVGGNALCENRHKIGTPAQLAAQRTGGLALPDGTIFQPRANGHGG